MRRVEIFFNAIYVREGLNNLEFIELKFRKNKVFPFLLRKHRLEKYFGFSDLFSGFKFPKLGHGPAWGEKFRPWPGSDLAGRSGWAVGCEQAYHKI